MDRYSGLPAYHQAKHRIFRARARWWSIGMTASAGRWWVRMCRPGPSGSASRTSRASGSSRKKGEKYLAFQFEALMPVRELKVRGAHNQSNALAALALGHAVGLPFAPCWIRCVVSPVCRTVASGSVSVPVSAITTTPRPPTSVLRWQRSKASRRHRRQAGADRRRRRQGRRLLRAARSRGALLPCRGTARSRRPRLAEALGEAAVLIRVASLEEAVQRAAECAESGDAVLLSPACASLDMFKNFEERGRLFAAAVEALD